MKTLLSAMMIVLVCSAGSGNAQIAPFDQIKVCTECHGELAQDLKEAHVHAVFKEGRCSSCHNPHAANHEGMLNAEQGILCQSCHEGISDRLHMTYPHPPASNGNCTGCHDPHASALTKLKQKELPTLCIECHTQAEAWRSMPVVHRPVAQGRCLSCHDSHGSDDRGLLSHPTPAGCVRCHKEDAAMKTAHAGRSLMTTDCTACHDPHASATKGLLRAYQHKPFASGNCSTCHPDLKSQGSFAVAGSTQELCVKCHRGIESFKQASFKHNLNSEESCLNCHNPHAANGESLLKRPQAELCMGCHFNDVKGDKARYVTHDGMDCVNCHLPHGGEDAQLLKVRSSELCADCHESAHRVSHPSGPNVIDPRTDQPISCLSCHQLHGADFAKYLPLNPDMALCVQCHNK